MNKHHYLFLIVVSILASTFFLTTYSYAQPETSESLLPSDYGVFIFVQTFLRNSHGELVAYLSADKFSSINLKALDNLLNFEESENDPVITINGQKFQIIKRQVTIHYEQKNVIASTIIAHSTNGTLSMVARFAHDGYPILPGEKVTTVWTFIRPID